MADQQRPTPPAAAKAPIRRTSSNRRVSRRLVITSSAAVLAIYAVGYVQTKPAADRIAAAASQFQASQPAAPPSTTGNAPVVSVAPATPTAPSPPTATPSGSGESTSSVTNGASGVDNSPGLVSNPTPVVLATVAPPATATPVAAAAKYKDGTFTGTGTSRHGDISAQVVVKGGKIVSAQITACYTRYPCSRISDLPGEVISQQSTNVDMVSGATDSSEAYLQAIDNALQSAA